jgi:hypothetical protein
MMLWVLLLVVFEEMEKRRVKSGQGKGKEVDAWIQRIGIEEAIQGKEEEF